jgi:DNA primase
VELKCRPELVKKDLGALLIALEAKQEAALQAMLTPKDDVPAMSAREREDAMTFLQDPHLIDRLLSDFDALGVVGERVNKLAVYLCLTSRKMDKPLGLLIQSTSSAGKTSLMDSALALLPPEDVLRYSAMTGQSLYYLGEKGLAHKALCICEEEGARRASYALKLLQSDGRLTIAAAEKDEKTGRLKTSEYSVQGPVALLLSTTSTEVDEELQNRCLTLTVDESRDQTRRIHALQRGNETIVGLMRRERENKIRSMHQNAQRLLRPLAVVNPYAEKLTFADGKTRTRRDHMKYLTLIRVVTLLHQYQREVKTQGGIEYIEATLADIALANTLSHEVLGTTLDELPPQTRNLLSLITACVQSDAKTRGLAVGDIRFTRREVREWTDWGNTQLKVHLHRLEEMEYLSVQRTKQGGFVYELMYQGEGREGQAFVLGLRPIDELKRGPVSGGGGLSADDLDGERSGVKGLWSGAGRGVVGPWSAGGRGKGNAVSPNQDKALREGNTQKPENGYKPPQDGPSRNSNRTSPRSPGQGFHGEFGDFDGADVAAMVATPSVP